MTAPDGQVYSQQSNADADSAGDLVRGNAFQIYRRNPAPGRWTLSVFTGMVSGQELQQQFTVKVAYNTVKVTANLPNNAGKALTAGQAVQVPVKITNTGVAPQTYFADGRLDSVGDLPLAELSGAEQPIALPVSADVVPFWLVPTDSPKLTVAATADQPVNLDIFAGQGEPELYSAAIGNGATVNVNAAQVTPGIWAADIGQSGPFGESGAPAGTVSVSATAHAQLFDPNVTSNAAGDIWLQGLATTTPDPATLARVKAGAALRAKSGVGSKAPATAASAAVTSAQAATGQASSGPGPVYLQPGESATITVTITPSGAKGSVVTGHLYVDNFNFFVADGDELIDLPYTYSIK